VGWVYPGFPLCLTDVSVFEIPIVKVPLFFMHNSLSTTAVEDKVQRGCNY
jgi:hypothetical protein